MANQQLLKAGIRIDGGKRRDLNPERIAARMANVERDSPTSAQAAARARAAEKRSRAERKAAENGQDGATVSRIKLRKTVATQGTVLQSMRCRPGTFEWRYGRDKQGALFHAGSQFAQLWEKAGIAVASSADFMRGTRSGYITGMAEGRLDAIGKLRRLMGGESGLGHAPSERLIAYCVLGKTAAELARGDAVPEREMTAVLNSDLRTCAKLLGLGA